MFKKIKMILIMLLLSFIITNCSTPSINKISSTLRITKPRLDFYTSSLKYSLKKKNNTAHISIFYTKTGKNKVIPSEYIDRFNMFINSIKPSHFITYEEANLGLKDPEYKLTIFINNNPKFIINIFNDKFVSIHPWDGMYEPDLINISSFQTKSNIYNLAEFIIKNNFNE